MAATPETENNRSLSPRVEAALNRAGLTNCLTFPEVTELAGVTHGVRTNAAVAAAMETYRVSLI